MHGEVQRFLLFGEPPAAPAHALTRADAWKLALGVPAVDARTYTQLVQRRFNAEHGASIADDTFRTFKNCPSFHALVPHPRLVRVLHAHAHACHDEDSHDGKGEGEGEGKGKGRESEGAVPRPHTRVCGYVQGLNVVGGALLFVLPEPDAAAALHRLTHHHLRTYFTPDLRGARCGAQLVDACLQHVDPHLHAHLRAHGLSAPIFAFAWVLTLCACSPPLAGVVALWDRLFALGVWMNVVVCVARVVHERALLLRSAHPMAVLGRLEVHHPRAVLGLACVLAKQLPADVLELVKAHTHDHGVVDRVLGE